MEIRVETVAFPIGQDYALVTGRPVNDPTKLVVAMAEARIALLVVASNLEGDGEGLVTDVPDWAIREIFEAP